MNRDFDYVNENDDASKSNKQLSSKKFIPVLDNDHHLKNIIFADRLRQAVLHGRSCINSSRWIW